MTISVLDRLKLGKELSDLMQAQKTAPVLQRVTIGKQIVDVMLKLGTGTAAQPAAEPQQQTDPVVDEVPKIVTDFWAVCSQSPHKWNLLMRCVGSQTMLASSLRWSRLKNRP